MVTIKSPSCATAYGSDQTSIHRRAQDFDVGENCHSPSYTSKLIDLHGLASWRREPFIKHQIYKNPGHRHVQPDWDRPTSDPCMPVPSPTKNRNKRQNDQRQGHKGQQNVRGEDRKIDRGEPARVSGRFLANARMISDVANQKTDRRGESYDHAQHVTTPGAAPDEIPAGGNKNGAHEIKRGIES